MLKNPETPSNKEMLERHKVKTGDFSKEQATRKRPNLIDENKVDWKQLEMLGVSKDFLKNTKNLEPMAISVRPCHTFRLKPCHFERWCNYTKKLIFTL